MCVTQAKSRRVRQKYGVEVIAIPSGVEHPTSGDPEVVRAFGLEHGKYILNVARMVPEKRQLDLIEAFEHAQAPGWKLVLVGELRAAGGYGEQVRVRAEANENIVCTGFQTGDALKGLLSNAGAFVLPSSHEGFPIAALEAMSHGLRVFASDIVANRELCLPAARYFPLGDCERLAWLLDDVMRTGPDRHEAQAARRLVQEKYDWSKIAQATLDVYRETVRPRSDKRHTTASGGGA